MLFALIPSMHTIDLCPGISGPRPQSFNLKGNSDRL